MYYIGGPNLMQVPLHCCGENCLSRLRPALARPAQQGSIISFSLGYGGPRIIRIRYTPPRNYVEQYGTWYRVAVAPTRRHYNRAQQFDTLQLSTSKYYCCAVNVLYDSSITNLGYDRRTSLRWLIKSDNECIICMVIAEP